MEVHLGRSFRIGRVLKHDPQPVDDELGTGLVDRLGRCDERGRCSRDSFPEARIDLPERSLRQKGPKLKDRTTHHRRAGHYVLADGFAQEAIGSNDPDVAPRNGVSSRHALYPPAMGGQVAR